MRTPLALGLGVALALGSAPASADSIDDELNALDNLTIQQNQQAGSALPSWCPPPGGINLLGVVSETVNLKPGDYLLVSATHPAGIKRSKLEQTMSPLLEKQREEAKYAQWGRASIEEQEKVVDDRLRKIDQLQKWKAQASDDDQRRSLQKDIDEQQKFLSKDQATLARYRTTTEQHQNAYAQLKGQTDPMLVESEKLYNEAVEASKQCQ